MNFELKKLDKFSGRPGPLLFIIMDGVGIGKNDETNAVYMANTPNLDKLFKGDLATKLQAHGKAVGLPSDDDINASSDIDFSKDKVNEVAIGKKGSETAGYVVTVTDSDGYGGDIKFTVGISTDGKVLGVSFLSISETAGLGMRAKQDPSFTSQFTAKSDAVASFSVVTDGSASESNANVDAIGGSTITSKSVTKGVNYALAVYKLVAGN